MGFQPEPEPGSESGSDTAEGPPAGVWDIDDEVTDATGGIDVNALIEDALQDRRRRQGGATPGERADSGTTDDGGVAEDEGDADDGGDSATGDEER